MINLPLFSLFSIKTLIKYLETWSNLYKLLQPYHYLNTKITEHFLIVLHKISPIIALKCLTLNHKLSLPLSSYYSGYKMAIITKHQIWLYWLIQCLNVIIYFLHFYYQIFFTINLTSKVQQYIPWHYKNIEIYESHLFRP